MYTVGIDAGSRSIKVAVVDANLRCLVASDIADQGLEQDTLASQLYQASLQRAGIAFNDVACVIATGYGRNTVSIANATITEITCHAVGVRHQLPDVMSIVEIGGQDSKFIRLDNDGAVRDFAMNDRCAAGTGRFLEVVANRLGDDVATIGHLAETNAKPLSISSMCVVFAETEIIGLIAGGARPSEILAGVQASIARRVAAMAGTRIEGPVAFTGGVALVTGMMDALARELDLPICLPQTPQMTGALGAALLAAQRLHAAQ